MKKILLILFAAACCLTSTYAQQPRRGVPATPHPIQYVQPDGDTLVYRLHGDERMHFQTTLDGYLIKQNKRGKFCYARYIRKGAIKTYCTLAQNKEQRSAREQRWVERKGVKKY